MTLMAASKDNGRIAQRTFAQKIRRLFRPRQRRHDPFLVLSLATFNSGDSWAEVFSPLKVRENVG